MIHSLHKSLSEIENRKKVFSENVSDLETFLVNLFRFYNFVLKNVFDEMTGNSTSTKLLSSHSSPERATQGSLLSLFLAGHHTVITAVRG